MTTEANITLKNSRVEALEGFNVGGVLTRWWARLSRFANLLLAWWLVAAILLGYALAGFAFLYVLWLI